MKYFGFSHSPSEEVELVEFRNRADVDTPVVPQDELVELIFAPDPVTGNPSSALGMLLRNNSEKVREVIRTHFFTDSGVGNGGVDDPDLAMSGVKLRYESNEEYINRLFEAANSNGDVES